MNWKALAPKRPWLPAPWRGDGEGEADGWKVGKVGGDGEWGIFFSRKKEVKRRIMMILYDVSRKMPVKDWTLFVHFFFEYHDSSLNLGHKHEGQDAHTVVFFLRVKTLYLGLFGQDPGRLVWFMLRLGCFFWRFPNLIQDNLWKKSLDRTTFLVVKVWRIPFLQKGNMHFPGKLLWLRSQQKTSRFSCRAMGNDNQNYNHNQDVPKNGAISKGK